MIKLFTLKNVLGIGMITGISLISYHAFTYGSGQPPAAHTGAPGESNCTSCHGGSLNPNQSNLNNLTLTGNLPGGGYAPDSIYTMTLSYSQSGIGKWGFQVTALLKSNNDPAGTLTQGSGQSKQTLSVGGKTRQYINHSSAVFNNNSVSWTFTWKAPANANDTVVFYPTVNAADGTGGTGSDQIYAKAINIVPSPLLSTPSFGPGKINICALDTVTFHGSGTNNPVSYNWTFSGAGVNTTSSTLQNPNVRFNSQIGGNVTVTLRITNAIGVSRTISQVFQVRPAPSATITSFSPNDTVCAGEQVTLNASFQLGNKYLWNTGNPGDTLNTVTVNQTGSYTVKVTNTSGCSNTSAPLNILVKSKPVISISPASASICEGDSIWLKMSNVNFTSYEIFKDGASLGTFLGPIDSVKVGSATSANFKVIGFDGSCYTDSSNAASITVNDRLEAPQARCGVRTTSSVEFEWFSVLGATSYEVSTNGGQSWSAPSSGATGLSHEITGLNFNQNINLLVRANNASPCPGFSTPISCSSLPCSQFNYTIVKGNNEICPGDSTFIAVSDLDISSFGISFNGAAYTSDTLFWVKPGATTNYSIDIIDSSKLNCPALNENAEIIVKVIPALSIQGPNQLCEGDGLRITASPGFASYSYLVNGSSVSSSTNNIYEFAGLNDGDLISVEASLNGCTAKTASNAISVNPVPNVGFTTSINGRTVNFSDTTSGTIGTRKWYFGDGDSSDAVNPTHTYDANGSYFVDLIIVNDFGCTNTARLQVTVTNVSVDFVKSLGIEVYPNPAESALKVSHKAHAEPLKIKILDLSGKTLIELNSANQSELTEINLSDLANGVYMVQISNGSETWMTKVVKK